MSPTGLSFICYSHDLLTRADYCLGYMTDSRTSTLATMMAPLYIRSFRFRFFGHLSHWAPDQDHRRVIAAAL